MLSPTRHPSLCALLTGLLLILCFPHAQLTLLGWVALTPLVATLTIPRSRLRCFWLGYLAGLVFFAGTCAWIYDVMRIYGHLPALAAAGVLVLFVVAFALFLGFFSLLMGELARRWQILALVLAPFLWVAAEWLRTYIFFGGFPWNLLGYAVAPHIGWVQPAAYTGVYGISFLLASGNALLAAYWLAPTRARGFALLLAALALFSAQLWAWQLSPVPTTNTAVLVQTNLPQQETFDPRWIEHNRQEIAQLEELTRETARQPRLWRGQQSAPTLIVWPELPVSIYFHHDPAMRGQLLQLAQATRSDFLVGIIDYRPGPDGKPYVYNSAALISSAGGFVGQYDKIHLVPFGEYLPWAGWLKFLGGMVREVSDFHPGREAAVMPVGSPRGLAPSGQGRLTVIICYEAIFPGLVRTAVARGAEVVVNISNDGWFGRSAAPAQHLNMARLRAVETRRFLLRATNTGFTAVVDPYGRIVAQAKPYERTALVAGFDFSRQQSFYARNGDWFPALCALVTVAACARKFWLEAVEA
ncbi:MAG: apolipoprotein N-acyltransferase [Candidatus Acidiferrales bacterium]